MAWKQGRKCVQMRACVWARPGPRRHRRAGAPRLDRLHPVSPALGAPGLAEGLSQLRLCRPDPSGAGRYG